MHATLALSKTMQQPNSITTLPMAQLSGASVPSTQVREDGVTFTRLIELVLMR